MPEDPTTATAPVDAPLEAPGAAVTGAGQVEQITEDLLVEDVSIDGMCGVY